MSKGIIVVDKIPQTCQHIRGNKEEGCPFGGTVCQITRNDVFYHSRFGSKPDWCPIRPMPGKVYHEDYCDNGRYDKGWNDCLKEILKGGDVDA